MLLGLIKLISNTYIFASISIISRIFQGFGSALSSTLVYSIVSFLCNEEELKTKIGYLELGYYLGVTIGPPFSAFFSHYFSFSSPFIICGSIFIVCLFFVRYLDETIDDDKDEIIDNEELGFFKILFNFVII